MFKILALILSAALLVTGTFYFTLAYLQAKSEAVVNTFTAGKISLTLKESEVDQYGNIKYYTAASFDENDDLIDGSKFFLESGTVEEGVVYDRRNYVQENNYKLVPGQTYTKDPVVTVEKGNEPCFLYIAVHNGLSTQLVDLTGDIFGEGTTSVNIEAASGGESGYKTISEQLVDSGWRPLAYTPNEGDDSNSAWEAKWEEAPSSGDYAIYYRYFGTEGSSLGDQYIVKTLDNDGTFGTFDSFKIDTNATSELIAAMETCYQNDEIVSRTPDYGDIPVMITTASTIEVYAFAVQSAGFANTFDGVKAAWEATFGRN